MTSPLKKKSSIKGKGIGLFTDIKYEVGQGGKMKQKPDEKAKWKRSSDKLTPREA